MSNKNKKASKSSQDERIVQLTKENLRLKNEVAELKNELQQRSAATRRFTKKRDAIHSMFLHQARRENTFSQSSKSAYFSRALKNASVVRAYSQILNTVKRFTFVTTTVQVILFILTILKSGIIFLISTSAFIVSLPFVLLISGIGTIFTMLGSKKATAENTPILSGKNVCVFFPAKKSVIKNRTYFADFVRTMADRPNTVCVIVTQGFLFSRGISNEKKFFFTSRLDAPNVLLVRRHYYFKLKKRIIEPLARDLTEIY